MEREVVKNNRSLNRGEGLCRAPTETATTTTSATSTADFVLQWGNRKRLRCMKFHVKDDSTVKTTVRVERRVVRAVDKDTLIYTATTTTATADNNNLNLRRHPPPPPPPPPRILRNSESSCAMRGQSNGVRGGSSSSDRGGGGGEKVKEKKVNKPSNAAGGGSPSSEMGQDGKKGGSSSGSEAIPVWPPKFVIALTNKEKEEDFMAIKGSKLPQRPKKRAKFIQRNLNLVCPGSWLCDLTLERYEVREKKISKKRARGLKAMGNMDSDSD